MKYALIDGEIHRHDSETAAFLPLTLAEAQHVVDAMNALTAKDGKEKLLAITALVTDVQNDASSKGPDE